MKKTILLIALLFSGAIFSQDYQGLWSDTQVEDNYVVISYNEKNGYEFINFSFAGNNLIKEEVLSVENDLILVYEGDEYKDIDTLSIKTRIKHENIDEWVVYAEYRFVDESIIEVLYTGDYHATHNLIKKKIK
tara:strand:+ start:990 stop:1388 length:399 start_codon:yes stop_codon:yes gene_type:complete